MISDVQLAVFCNVLGVFLFLLVVAFHYINANMGRYAKKRPNSTAKSHPQTPTRPLTSERASEANYSAMGTN